jgi:hypothetical protein
MEKKSDEYDHINPAHYKRYSVEVIDMMERIYGIDATILFCEMCAFKYRMRMGTKPSQPIDRDIEKEQWYLDRAEKLKGQIAKDALIDWAGYLKTGESIACPSH